LFVVALAGRTDVAFRMEETGRLIAVVLLASFAIDRVAATVDFFLSGETLAPFERRRRMIRVGVSALLALAIVGFTGIRILGLMKFASPNRWIDFFLTWLVLVGGADRIDHFIAGGSGHPAAPSRRQEIRPVQIYIDKKDVTEDALLPAP
jgi:hypothetical protein